MAVRFPTDTVVLTEITDNDKILVADNEDADASRDATALVWLTYVNGKMIASNNAVPAPTAEAQMLISDATNNWTLANTFNAGEY